MLSAATTTTLIPSPAAPTYGQIETLTATVSSQAGIPNAGTVTFFDSTTPLGTVPVSNGAAQLATATFTAGLHALTATYSGDGANFAGSSSVLRPDSAIQTVAGTGTVGYSGDGGLATSAELNVPYGIAVDSHGNLFIADLFNSVVREVNATTHVISTVAGTGTAGYNGDGILATSAQLNTPVGVAVDSSGNIFIADDTDDRIREVNAATGLISTVAGTGVAGYNGDGIAATSAELNGPVSIAVDAAGNIFFTDFENQRVREVNAATGLISTVAGTGTAGYNGDGIPATSAELYDPYGLAMDAAGNLYIGDAQNNLVREVSASTGLISTVAGTGTAGYNGDGIAATSAQLNDPADLAVDAAGNLFISDAANQRVREVDAATGLISTIAGTGADGYGGDSGSATSAELGDPLGVAVDAAGNVFIGDSQNASVREIASGAFVAVAPATPTLTVSDPGGTFNGAPFPASVSVTDSNNQPISLPLSINYSTFLGGSGTDEAANVTTDSSGDTYVTGITFSTDFPTTPGAYQTTYDSGGGPATFVAKFDPSGNLLWSTLINGSSGFAIAVDAFDNVYVAGSAGPDNFTTTPGAFQTAANSQQNGFVAKLSSDGSALLWATYLGGSGSDEVTAITVDNVDNVYVAGFTTSTDFPTHNALQSFNPGTYAGFASELNSSGSALVFSTYGGGGDTFPSAIKVDAAGNIYVNGSTDFSSFPTTPGAFQTQFSGQNDAFVLKLGPSGTSLIYSTFLGDSGYTGSSDFGMAVDAAGDVFVTGFTFSADFPMVNAFQSAFTGSQDAYVAELNPSGSALIGSTYFGGSSTAGGSSIALDSQGNVYIAGVTDSPDLPLVNPLSTSGDFYVAEFNLSSGTLINSTYLGSTNDQGLVTPIVVDDSGNVVVAGETASSGFPTTANAFQPNYGGGSYDAFVYGLTTGLTFTYYWGTSASGTPLAGPPSDSGTYTVVATFTSNSPNYASAQSAPVTFTISPSGPLTPTVVALDGGGAYDGQPFAAIATATSPGGTSVSGSFAFTYYVGTSATGTGSSVAPVDAGTYTVVADFTSSDPNYTDAESAPATFTITPATTTTTVGASAAALAYGQSETLTATVSSTAVTANVGTVTFFDGTTAIGTAPVTNGTATLTTTTLSQGVHVISATYSGDGLDFTPSSSALSSSSIIQTVAGTGVAGSNPGGIPATSANLFYPYGVAVDSAGDIFISEDLNHIVQEVDAKTGLITTVAGTGTAGYNGDGILATSAELNFPTGIALDAAGDLFIVDASNNRIREVSAATGVISTVAGNGVAGYNGDGILATSAELNTPLTVTLDAAGDLFITDWGNNLVREVSAATGLISTIAGNGTAGYNGDGIAANSAELNGPDGLAVDSAGDIFIAEQGERVREVSAATGLISTVAGTGTYGYNGDGIAASSAQLAEPGGLALDAAGNLFIADTGNSRIREVDAGTGLISTVAGTGVNGYNRDGIPAGSAELFGPSGITFDTTGDLLIADLANSRVREVVTGNTVVTVTTGAPITPTVVASDAGGRYDGNPFSATATATGLRGVAVSGSFAFTYYAGSSATGTGSSSAPVDAGTYTVVADFTSSDPVYTAAESAPVTFTITPAATSTTVAVSAAVITYGQSETLTATVADAGGPTPNAGTVTFFAGATPLGTAPVNNGTATLTTTAIAAGVQLVRGTYSGDGLDFAGSSSPILSSSALIETVAGTGVFGYNGDGIPANTAEVTGVNQVAVDAHGNLFIADGSRIREVNAVTHLISTVAGNGTQGYNGDGIPATSAELDSADGIAVDSAGDLFIADTGNGRIREVSAATGLITTVAGNGVWGYNGDGIAATSAELNLPQTVAVDAVGDIFIADYGNQRIREVNDATGLISTVAGTGVAGYNGDGILATTAQLNRPFGVAVDSQGNVFVADLQNQRVREVNVATGLISTVAGTDLAGYNGDGIPATSAELTAPADVAVDAAGNVFIAELGNRVREVSAATGLISTIAGTGLDGYNGDGTLATSAQLNFPSGVAVDSGHNVFIGDQLNDRVREIVNPDAIMVAPAAPSVIAVDAGGTYDGNPFAATATATGIDGVTPVSGSFTFTYYVGSTVGGSGSSTASTNAGTYTVVAAFTSSDSNYADAQSAPVTFTIGQATPSVVVSDAGGTYNGNPFPATATATGIGGASVSGSFTFTYYVGSTVSGTGSSTAPTNAGTYTVVAAFASADANYANAQSAPLTFTVGQATPVVAASDAGGTYNGNPFAATATATGIGGASVSGSFAFTYYVGSTVSGTGSSTAPTNAGTYTVVAAFASSNSNYANAQSAPVTFSVGQATPAAVASDAGGTYNGNPFPATATATGIGGASVSGSFTFTYYVSSTVNGNGSATAPTNAGTYTVVAAFASSNPNYANAQSGPYTFTITQAHTTTALASSASTSVTAQNVTFTATVALTTGGGVPLGSVSFLDGTTSLATVALSNFSAQFTTSALALGNHSITAVYSGNANFSGSGSTALTQSVQTAVLESDPTAPGHTALFVGGTPGNDLITLAPGSAASTVKVTVTESSPVTYNYSATFSVATADRVFVFDGTGNDTIKVGAITLPVAINGGNGNDTFQFTAAPVASSTIAGGTGLNTLIGPNLTNSWTITALNAGSFDGAAFTNVQNLTGNNGVDTFTFGPGGSLSGSIAGSGGADRLIGSNVSNTWDITGTNAGTFNGIAFTGIKSLTGGSGLDTFRFSAGGSVGGAIDGGGGGDWLDYSALTTAVTVKLATGTATHTGGVTNIQNVRAGSGNANLTGNSQGNILVGGSGNDTITGGSGRSLLIGGRGKDTIKGGSSDDLLISGDTDYDNNNAALMAVFAEWGRTDETFQQRISNIRGTTTGGLNGSYDLNSTTVHDDGVVDSLTGNGGLDWFWVGSNDKVTDLQPGDQLN